MLKQSEQKHAINWCWNWIGTPPPLEEGYSSDFLEYIQDVRVRDCLLWRITHAGTDLPQAAKHEWWEFIRTFLKNCLDQASYEDEEYPCPNQASGWAMYSIACWALGDVDEAQAAITIGLTHSPKHPLLDLLAQAHRQSLPFTAWESIMGSLTEAECLRGKDHS
jgi:Domain of unknown function (DUF4192)